MCACFCCFSYPFPDTKSSEKTNHNMFLWYFWLAIYVVSSGVLYDQKWEQTEIQEAVHPQGLMISGNNAINDNT